MSQFAVDSDNFCATCKLKHILRGICPKYMVRCFYDENKIEDRLNGDKGIVKTAYPETDKDLE